MVLENKNIRPYPTITRRSSFFFSMSDLATREFLTFLNNKFIDPYICELMLQWKHKYQNEIAL